MEDFVEGLGITPNKLAVSMGVPPPLRVNEIVHGKRGITADTGIRLALYFGTLVSDLPHPSSPSQMSESSPIRRARLVCLYLCSRRENCPRCFGVHCHGRPCPVQPRPRAGR